MQIGLFKKQGSRHFFPDILQIAKKSSFFFFFFSVLNNFSINIYFESSSFEKEKEKKNNNPETKRQKTLTVSDAQVDNSGFFGARAVKRSSLINGTPSGFEYLTGYRVLALIQHSDGV